MQWPQVGGCDALGTEIDDEELFARMCIWDDNDYVMAAATTDGSDEVAREDGLFDGHCYTVLSVLNDVAGSDVDLIQMRNPHGTGELISGIWTDEGSGWDLYPEIKKVVQPVVRNDGVFWVSKTEFVYNFVTIYLCAKDMKAFSEKLTEEGTGAEMKQEGEEAAAKQNAAGLAADGSIAEWFRGQPSKSANDAEIAEWFRGQAAAGMWRS